MLTAKVRINLVHSENIKNLWLTILETSLVHNHVFSCYKRAYVIYNMVLIYVLKSVYKQPIEFV